MSTSYKVTDLPVRGDDKGSLIAIEGAKDIPFSVARIFYIYGTQNNIIRGLHANRNSQFVLVCVHGSCDVKIKTPGQDDDAIIHLDAPHKTLWLDKMVWKEMYNFSKDAVLLVLSDHSYDPDEYIHSYDDLARETAP